MFGIGKKKPQTFEVDDHEEGRFVVIAKDEKEAYKNLPEDVREKVKAGRTRLKRVM